jgi:hypothetical protein
MEEIFHIATSSDIHVTRTARVCSYKCVVGKTGVFISVAMLQKLQQPRLKDQQMAAKSIWNISGKSAVVDINFDTVQQV